LIAGTAANQAQLFGKHSIMHLVALVMEFQYENEFAHRCPAIFDTTPLMFTVFFGVTKMERE
jgi:hypothetical protein